MIKIEKYTGMETYQFPDGNLATPEIVQVKYPAVAAFTHIVETDSAGQIMWALENLSAVRSQLGIDPALSEDEAIAAIETLRNKVPEQIVSAEERIAAAMEFQNLMNY